MWRGKEGWCCWDASLWKQRDLDSSGARRWQQAQVKHCTEHGWVSNRQHQCIWELRDVCSQPHPSPTRWDTQDGAVICVSPTSEAKSGASQNFGVSKESTWTAGDPGSILGSGRLPGEGNGNPLQYSFLENYMDRRAWQATVHMVTMSWTQLIG